MTPLGRTTAPVPSGGARRDGAPADPWLSIYLSHRLFVARSASICGATGSLAGARGNRVALGRPVRYPGGARDRPVGEQFCRPLVVRSARRKPRTGEARVHPRWALACPYSEAGRDAQAGGPMTKSRSAPLPRLARNSWMTTPTSPTAMQEHYVSPRAAGRTRRIWPRRSRLQQTLRTYQRLLFWPTRRCSTPEHPLLDAWT